MAIKEYLAIGGLSSDLIGAFLLAVPALLGVRTALGWVLRVRGRLRRHLHLLNLSLSHHRRALKRKREIMFGWGGPSDLKKQAAGEQVDITPYYLIPSSLFVILELGICWGNTSIGCLSPLMKPLCTLRDGSDICCMR